MLKRSGYPHLHVLATLSLLGIIILGSTFPSPGMQAYAAPDPPEGLRIGIHDQTGKATFIGANPNTPFKLQSAAVEGLLAEDRSMQYLDYFSDLLGLSSPSKELMVKRQSALQSSGGDSVRYQQTYQGIPILAGELIVNTDHFGGLLSISGEISPDLSLSVKPTVTVEEVGEIALGVVSKGNGLDSDQLRVSDPELWIFDERLLKSSERPAELVWRMEVRAMNSEPINELVLINAQTGGVSLHFNQIDTAWSGNYLFAPKTEVSISTNISQPIPAQNTAPNPVSIPTLNGGNTWYVSTAGDNSNDCATTATECASINGALGKAGFVAGDTIKVASGIYTGTGTYAVTLTQDATLSGGWGVDFLTQAGFSIIDGESDRRSLRVNSGVTASVGQFIIQHGTIGIYNFGNLTLDRSTVSNNGGLTTFGGGIYNNGVFTLNNSAVRDNENNSAGGGIDNNGSLTLNNSTVSNNRSTTAGGGIYTRGSMYLNSSTISNNIASYGGGIWRNSGGVDMENTIIAGNTADPSPDCGGGTLGSSGYNLVGNISNCYLTTTTGDQTDVNPNLGELISGVDVPKYYPLLAGSPAIDAGNPGGCMGSAGLLDTDQRGASRVGACDIGAYEYTIPGPADTVAANRGSPQRARPLGTYDESLQAVVMDSIGSPVNATSVTFTAPTSGPSGTFEDSGTHVTTAVTNESGIATAAAFTANITTGTYIVSGTVSGVVSQAEFQLTNFTWYVSTGGDDANDWMSPITTCATIDAVFGKPGIEAGDAIYIGSGTYTGAGSEVVLVSQDASLSGGWDATFTAQSGTSIIDGEDTRRGITLGGGRTADIDHFAVQHCSNSGIYIPSGATLTLHNSAIRNNSANAGGGILNESGTLFVINSTISRNSATFGGGIHNESGDALILSSTITDNTGIPFGGGISNGGGGNVTLQNSIVAGNINSDGADCRGEMISLGYNLIGEVILPWCEFTPTTGDLTNLDAKLGPLVGLPGHHPLEVASPAINAGNPAGCVDNLGNPLLTDQRGIPRVGVCDIGAFEYTVPGAPAGIVAGYGSPQRTPPGTDFNNPLQAAVIDSNGGLVETSELVTFTAPGSGPSGIFEDSGTVSTTAYTDATGIATSSILHANTTPGFFSVSATVVGAATPAEFQLDITGWYVSPGGSDSNECDSFSSPCATIEGVLGKGGFLPGDTVLVESGTYTGSGTEVVDLDKDVRLIGGWNSGFTTRTGFSTIDGEENRRGMTLGTGVIAFVEFVAFQNGRSTGGGGIFNRGDLTLNECSVGNSIATGETYSEGGGIYNTNTATLTLNNSTIYNNSAVGGGGGGVFNTGGTIILNNSTVSGNIAPGGAGIISDGSLTLNNSIISNNTATIGGAGGIENGGSGTVTLRNSIITWNNGPAPDCKGVIDSSGYNLIGDTTNCTFTPATGDLTNIHANITQLQDNGGLTLTHALAPGSPAIDAANPAAPGSGGDACEADDQRGVARPIDGDGVGGSQCDMGSYELDPALPPLIPPGDRITYDAENMTSLPGTFLCDELIPICTMGSDPHADAAHQHAADTYAFYSTYHGRNSLDDAGMPIISSVHYDSGFGNAYWDGDQVVYGDAYGFPLADDIVAHELTHGVTDYTSNLFFYYQSGAINSSFSDLWGEFVDQTNGSGDDSPAVKWLIGEDITGMGVIRDMEDPPVYGDPDKMTSPNYYTGSADLGLFGDNGGVHTNSGVNNKAVYLMTDGGSFNGQTVTALGIDKVAAIYYEVQTSLLTSGSDYGDLYNALFQGCLNLLGGPEGITTGDCDEVRDASDAVEMNLEPVPGYNPEAEICSTGKVPDDLFFDDFEAGAGNWTFEALTGTSSWTLATGYTTSGTKLLWGDDTATLSDSVSAMNVDVSLPSGSQPYLHFNHAFGFEDPDFDGAFLEYSTNGGGSWTDAGPLYDSGLDYTGSIIDPGPVPGANPNRGHVAFIADSHGYVSTRYDLSSLAGENVRFRWRVSTDVSYYDWGWFVDDVRIYSCVEPTTYQLYLPLIMR